jgi:hypothetical protein
MAFGHHQPQPATGQGQLSQLIHSQWTSLFTSCGQLIRNSLFDRFFRHTWACGKVVYREVRTARSRGRGQHGLKINRAQDASRRGPRSPGRSRHHSANRKRRAQASRTVNNAVRKGSDQRQALATLGAARGDDRSATAGLHAHEETVRTGAAGLGRLIGALHGLVLEVRPPPNHCRHQASCATVCGQTDIAEVAWRRIFAHAGRSRTKPCALGKPTIKAKTPFVVKHLHHKLCADQRAEGRRRAVDNCGWQALEAYNAAAQRTTCPQ